MQIKPVLESVSASGLGGGSSTLSWNHTLGNLGSSGLIIVGGIGKEEGGETNPEEIQSITFNGVAMTLIADANRNEFGCSMYELHGSNVPAAGTYTITITYKGSGTPNKTRGVCAAFRNIKQVTPLEQNTQTAQDSGSISLALTPQSINALFVGVYGQRTGNSYSLTTGQTLAVESIGTDATGVLIAYQIVTIPASTTMTIVPSNSETEGLIIATFKGITSGGGAFAFL